MKINSPQQLSELAWRDRLLAQEERAIRACLAAHPEWATDWDEARKLHDLLQCLAQPSPHPTFTSTVMASVREVSRQRPKLQNLSHPLGLWEAIQAWWPRVVLPLGTAALFLMTQGALENVRRERMAESVHQIGQVASALPGMEALQDFEAIQRLGQIPLNSEGDPAFEAELLAALQ